jgi:FixJ family two-component response regulator
MDLFFNKVDAAITTKKSFDTMVELKKNHENMKFVFITGNSPDNIEVFIKQINNYGIKKILYKPFRRQELLDTVQEALL